MAEKKKRLFCEINPACYAISKEKEVLKRNLKDAFGNIKFAKTKGDKLPNLVFEKSSGMIKKGKGINPEHQYNKVINIGIASGKINGMLIRPGQVFSFWKTVGKITKRKGYKSGRVLKHNKLIAGIGGGLCNLANTLHVLILHSPLTVTEFHMHSDALAPDHGKRIPFSAGTSVCYNNVDYRVKNNTDQTFQLLVWCDGEDLKAELRSEREIPYRYELSEENHRFKKEGDKFYRVSQIYKLTFDKNTDKLINKELVLNNHSEVMFDYDLIPEDQIEKEEVLTKS